MRIILLLSFVFFVSGCAQKKKATWVCGTIIDKRLPSRVDTIYTKGFMDTVTGSIEGSVKFIETNWNDSGHNAFCTVGLFKDGKKQYYRYANVQGNYQIAHRKSGIYKVQYKFARSCLVVDSVYLNSGEIKVINVLMSTKSDTTYYVMRKNKFLQIK